MQHRHVQSLHPDRRNTDFIMVETGDIILNLTPTEAVRIISVKPLGGNFSLSYVGVNSYRA